MAKTKIDDRSEKNIATLLPPVQAAARAFLQEALNAGFDVKIIGGTRTYAEQDALYAQGRNGDTGPVVTKARAGYSNHNFGVAFDVGLFEGKKYLENSPLYAKLAPLAKSQGLEWGGDWDFKDEPHYQMPTGLSLAQMRARHDKGLPVLGPSKSSYPSATYRLIVNGKEIEEDVAVQSDGDMIAPVRLLCEGLGASVAFDKATRTVTVTAAK